MIRRSRPVRKQVPPTEIKRFLGVNENPDGQYGLKLGEASEMKNFRITSNYQMKEREGYKTIFDLETGDIRGMWYGKLNGATCFLFAHGGHLYKGNLTDGTKTDLGTLTDAPTTFQEFGTKVYILNGHEYKSYDGTTLATVTGYRPRIAINAPATGGGTLFEEPNLLTGQKEMTFDGDGVATAFVLAESGIGSVDYVYVNEVLKTVTTDYTVNLTTGTITLTVAPANIPGNVRIGWTKGTGNRALIEKCRFAMDYSGQTDSRLFLWGNTDYKNRRFWTGLANGVPSAEYFEATAYDDLGSGQYAITDIEKQYDRQKIYFERGAMFSYYTSDDIEGITKVSFPAFDLNDEVGNVAFGQVQIIRNNPFTIDNGVHAWSASTVRDQTNEDLVSQRVQDSLTAEDLTKAITCNWKENNEYWLCIGSTVWIYNYLNDTWYKFDNIPAKCFLVVNGQLYFGTDGTIEKFDKEQRTDNGTAINVLWEMGFYDFEAEYLNKYMNNIWVAIKPEQRTSIDVQTVTNNEGTSVKQTIYYNLATYQHVDYAHWSYNTSYNPQPFYIEIQAMGFCFFKIILSNTSERNKVTVLSINLPARYGGKVR